MRYINLEASARQELKTIYHTHAKLHVRQSAHCLLLSDKGKSVPVLADTFFTRTHTVREWFNRWEAEGFKGLEIRPGRGLKPAIKVEDAAIVASIREEVALTPQSLRDVVERLNARWNMSFTVKQLKNFLKKKLKYSWRRFRECIKSCQDPHIYEVLVSQLCFYMFMEESGKLKIYYGDESGFSLEPCIPYGWQPAGEYVRITPVGGKRWLVSGVEPLNVFGLLSRDNDLHAFSTQGTIDTRMVIACMDEFVKTITKKTLVVLDMPPFTKAKSSLQKWGNGTKRDC
jgi:transposase